MKYLNTYKLFESNSEDTDVLMDLLRNDLEDISSPLFNIDDILMSKCDFGFKTDGNPKRFPDIEYESTGCVINDQIDPIDFSEVIVNKYAYTRLGFPRKSVSKKKNGLALLVDPEKGDTDDFYDNYDGTFAEFNDGVMQKVYDTLNIERFNSYGFEVVKLTGPHSIKIILIYKNEIPREI